MKTTTKTAIKHTLVVVFSFLLPLLPSLLANVHFGAWTNVEQAVLALLGAIYVTLTGAPAPTLTVNGQPVTGTTITQ